MKLFRGVNPKMYSEIIENKVIQPKNSTFEITFSHDGSIKCDGSATMGSSLKNAILGHQLNSSKFKTSGISTTPFLERAQCYALNNGTYSNGYILVFDTEMINADEYELVKVSEHVKFPNIPEDNEVILRRKDNSNISLDIVFEVIIISV